MKRKVNIYLSSLLFLALIGFHACKNKDLDVNSFKIEREMLVPSSTNVSITGSYSFIGNVNGMEINIGESKSLIDASSYKMMLEGNEFSVTIEGLKPSTQYYYCYSVDFGTDDDHLTETKSFTTLDAVTETPTVKIFPYPLFNEDSTFVRIKCEVVEDGGSEVAERGIFWNNLGDPLEGDNIMQHSNGGLGIYIINLEPLSLGKTYYVRAYAKNEAGLGLSDDILEIKTNAQVGTTVNIELIRHPEEGGTVNGGGSYEVGTQCTAAAIANLGYTFINWTENDIQVSSNSEYTFPVTTSRILVANFTRQAYVIQAQVDPENSGTVTGAGGYDYGEECTLTAAACNGYDFVKWTKGGSIVSTSADYNFTVTESAIYVAHFKIKNYSINVSANPSNGGTVSGGGTYDFGTTIILQAYANSGYTFDHWQDGNTENPRTITVIGNATYIAYFDAQPQAPQGAINGLFTINANGDQVYFSQGNLQYIGSASTPYWKFADNQWDMLGTTTGQNSTNQNVDRDLFGWGTSGWSGTGAIYYRPWDTDSSNGTLYGPSGRYDLTGTYAHADWGVHNTINSTTGLWRTLTEPEWNHVFMRTTSSGIRYAMAKVHNVNGVILLPDDWSTSYYTLSNTNSPYASFSSNTISATQWSTLEQHGAVFLPAAGFRNGVSVNVVGSYGYYWSASCDDDYDARGVYFFDSSLYSYSNLNRNQGRSVRLVCPAQ